MKSIKIKIVIVLLLIIFFGLLILFGSRKIYEGLDTTTDLVDINPKYNRTFTPGKQKLTGQYFINVYYAHPDVSRKVTTMENLSSMPIVYLYHNLPDDFKVCFSNSEKYFGNEKNTSSTTRIYIQKKENKDIKNITPLNLRMQYAVNKDKAGAGFIVWKEAQNDSAKNIKITDKFNTIPINILDNNGFIKNTNGVVTEFKPSETVNVAVDNVNGNIKNEDKIMPTVNKDILPITYTGKLNIKDGVIICFNSHYCVLGGLECIKADKSKDTGINGKFNNKSEGLGFLNLITYYFDLPKQN
jgi:hypothetical protein